MLGSAVQPCAVSHPRGHRGGAGLCGRRPDLRAGLPGYLRLAGGAGMKRGNIAFFVLMKIPQFFFAIFVILSILFLVRYYMSFRTDVRATEMELQANRLLYSPACLAYYDDRLQRAYPGVVDSRKVNPLQLDSCIRYGERNDFLAMKISLTELDGTPLKEATFNEPGIRAWLPRLNRQGPGGAGGRQMRRPVLYRDNGEVIPAVMDVLAIMPN